MQCKKYCCLHCGPRRVTMWRSVIEQARPERFITLSRVGDTLVEVGRVVTVVMRRLRRLGYHVEYLCTFERHRDARNGYHVHILQWGDYIPQRVLSDCLSTATHGRSFVVDIRRASDQVAGYVTKYVTKGLTTRETGTKPDGTVARPNRIRYSKGFFRGATTKEIRAFLLAEHLDRKRAEAGETIAIPDELADELAEAQNGPWRLIEVAELPRDADGQVDMPAAQAQYRDLVEARTLEQGTTVKPSRGGLHVVQYMLGERRRTRAEVEWHRAQRLQRMSDQAAYEEAQRQPRRIRALSADDTPLVC